MTEQEKKDRKKKAAALAALGFGVPGAMGVVSNPTMSDKALSVLTNGALGYGAYKAINNDVQSNAGNTALQVGGGLVGTLGALGALGAAAGTELTAKGLKEGDPLYEEVAKAGLTPGKARAIGHLGGTIPAAALSALGFATYGAASKRKRENKNKEQ
jgi:hypothetical protein